MSAVIDKFLNLVPFRSKTSPSGWIIFNAPCCHHRGHGQDQRKRAGIKIDNDMFVYNCFNCKFTTGWQPGTMIGEKLKILCKWLGASDFEIKELIFLSLKSFSEEKNVNTNLLSINFTEKELPEAAMPINDWCNSIYFADISKDIEPVIKYLHSRRINPESKDVYWSPSPGFIDRVIVPFFWQGRVVGYTARKIFDGKPKYISNQHPNFVFNVDSQQLNQKHTIVVEGPFDALAVNGLALLTNNINESQARIINSVSNEVIVVPDQDSAGLILYEKAKDLGWSIAVPNWEADIKDCADAVKRYGKLYVIVDILMTKIRGEIKINMAKKQLEKKLSLRTI